MGGGAAIGVQAGEPPPYYGGSARPDLGIRISSLPNDRVQPPSRKAGAYVAKILIKTPVRRKPGKGHPFWVARTSTKWSGGPQQLMVMRSRNVGGKEWLQVRLPIRPNRTEGWVPRDRVRLGHSNRFVVLDRSRRLVKLYRSGRVVSRFKVVVGAPSTPTPVGLFALYDRVRQADPNGFIGPWAMPLTAHSDALRRYDGGPGLVAIHGRAGASFLDPLGTARSHGCVRMNNSRVRMLMKSELGTPVLIKR